ncbi:disulfide bond formation protein B [Sulfitobacter sp. KE34]|uniref:Disulfide bond formation protein B n=1 Tax=Sulfitobacter faviae TaxID=1775881 RepID=A0AAX3LLI0_9RHOB|nr:MULTISPECIES: disulfide bond formation protein B [Sulfitobacter]MDF3349259.1 disulfide bond formation protein B [Sulfitobacter sp. KE12]MDF3352930.1 disulfide bond formation protein B [Sulfitobacter sp. KE27]MDF3356577.1 disulfide bond formation protein B [Sulfitobacter sp. KE33]MDF3361007.1 disulfide bond formation protein B [Sulfitobacter sp. Ks41]MDF3364001.1 disulfide bond formation protein B [Sulfitobacter sp. Ks34]
MTGKTLTLLATLGSAALLLGAFGFQHLGGYAPCQMCLWQRWPHAAAVLIGAIVLLGGPRVLAWLGAMAAAVTALIGIFHAGVEWGWWPGPSSCTGGGMDLGSLDGGSLLSTEGPSGLVMCDEIVWQFLGLSMAGWNAIFSFILIGLWVAAARKAA